MTKVFLFCRNKITRRRVLKATCKPIVVHVGNKTKDTGQNDENAQLPWHTKLYFYCLKTANNVIQQLSLTLYRVYTV